MGKQAGSRAQRIDARDPSSRPWEPPSPVLGLAAGGTHSGPNGAAQATNGMRCSVSSSAAALNDAGATPGVGAPGRAAMPRRAPRIRAKGRGKERHRRPAMASDSDAPPSAERSVGLKHGRIAMLATMGYIAPVITGKLPGYLSPGNAVKFA